MTRYLILLSVALFTVSSAFAQRAQIREKANGTVIGTTAAQKLGLHGATPVVQRAGVAQAAVGAQTGTLAIGSLKTLVFTGNSGTGACTVTGLAVGDVVSGVVNITDATDGTTSFSGTVSVVDQLMQTGTANLPAKKFFVIAGKNNTDDVSALKTLVNELRAALVEKGMIKGSN